MKEYFYVIMRLDGTTDIRYGNIHYNLKDIDAERLARLSNVFDGAFPWLMYEQEAANVG